MLPPAVKTYLDGHRDQQVPKLFELVRIPSIANRDDGNCPKAAEWISDFLRGAGRGGPGRAGRRAACGDGDRLRGGRSADRAGVRALRRSAARTAGTVGDSAVRAGRSRRGDLCPRGANDDKGQLFTHLTALEAYVRTHTPLPVNVKYLIEGEEECGSPTLENFIRDHAAGLTADAAIISDSEFSNT